MKSFIIVRKSDTIKMVLRHFIVFICTSIFLIGLLTGNAFVPRERIQATMERSAEYLNTRDTIFFNLIPNADCTKIDEYADSMLLNVAYNIDREHPLESILWAKYHHTSAANVKKDFRDAVFEDAPTNEQYLRYWHGSIIFVRLFHLLGDIRQMYVFHLILLVIATILLEVSLLRFGMKIEAVCMGIALIMVNIWVVPFCLEYYWMFIVMLCSSILTIYLSKCIGKNDCQKKEERLYILFLITGIVSAFLDFLTTETITLTIPLLLAMRADEDTNKDLREQKPQDYQHTIFMNCLLWLIGFVGMWVFKWILSATVLHIDVIPYLKDSMEYHLGIGDQYGYFVLLITGLIRNMMCLAPQGYGIIGSILTLMIITVGFFAPAAMDKIRLKSSIKWKRVTAYGVIGLIPFVRYFAIVHHMWWHYFFTYRALAATILALSFIILEIIEPTHRKAASINES